MVATRECAGPPSKMPPRNKGEAEKRKNEHPHRTHTKKKKPKEVANITGIEKCGFLVAVVCRFAWHRTQLMMHILKKPTTGNNSHQLSALPETAIFTIPDGWKDGWIGGLVDLILPSARTTF